MQLTAPTVTQKAHKIQKVEAKLFSELQLNVQNATNSHNTLQT
jgi:hypothetical protein